MNSYQQVAPILKGNAVYVKIVAISIHMDGISIENNECTEHLSSPTYL